MVSSDQNAKLCCPFSPDEVRKAVKQLGNLKAPGPDGFPGLFFDQFWEEVGENINRLTTEFMDGTASVEELNSTNIVLIPKVPLPETVGQFRPISLCNSSMKILSKLLANRLKPLLSSLILENQNAFVPDSG